VIAVETTVTDIRVDKPVTTLSTRITNQDGVAVLDGTAVVWRDPVVAGSLRGSHGEGRGKASLLASSGDDTQRREAGTTMEDR